MCDNSLNPCSNSWWHWCTRLVLGDMDRRAYPTDLTGPQWGLLAPLLPPDSAKGHPRTVDILRGGIPWRLMPHDLFTVGGISGNGGNGTWERVEEALRPMVRESEGREATPSAAIIDSQLSGPRKRGTSGLRRRQESLWTQAPHRSGHHRAALGCGHSRRQHPGPGWSQAGTALLGGFPGCRSSGPMGPTPADWWGGLGPQEDGCWRGAPRPGQPPLRRTAEEMGGRTDAGLADPVSPAQQRL